MKVIGEGYALYICNCSGIFAAINSDMDALEPDKKVYVGISATRSLLNGETRKYYSQQLEREELYHDDSQKVLCLKAIDNSPYVLFNGDIYPDGTHGYWINQGIAEFYEKEAIHLVVESE